MRTLKCIIPLKGGQEKVVRIPERAPKIERENAWAMTNGYRRRKDNNLYHVSIFTASEKSVILKSGFDQINRFIPIVLSYTVQREPEFPVSKDGFDMEVSDYSRPFTLPHRHVAILDRIFRIKKNFHEDEGLEKIWGVLCKNGIFDIWEPLAPYNRLTGSFDLNKGPKEVKEPQILLLRIFELDRTLSVEHQPTVTDLVTSSNGIAPLRLKRPIIPYDTKDRFYHDYQGNYTFENIGDRVEEHLEKIGALVKNGEVVINDTSKIEIPV